GKAFLPQELCMEEVFEHDRLVELCKDHLLDLDARIVGVVFTLNLVQQPLADLLVADEVYLEAYRSQVNGLQFGNDIPKLGPSHLAFCSDVEFRVVICLAEAHVGKGKMYVVVTAGAERLVLLLQVFSRTVRDSY